MLSGMKILLFFVFTLNALATDWPGWRGPNRDNKAAASAKPVTEWGENKNVRWKTPVPGRGHSTPVVIGDRIYLTTAEMEKQTQSLISFDRKTGKVIWQKVIHKGNLPRDSHRENSRASSTPSWDGKHLLTTFENDGQIKVSAVTPDGNVVWAKAVGPYDSKRPFGYGATPVLHNGLLIVPVETTDDGFIVALESKGGKERWRTSRTGYENWATPVVAKVAGKEQLLISGLGKITSFDPSSGKQFWDAPLEPLATCGTVVWTDDMVFASGGYPSNQTAGIMADGSGKVVWKNRERSYEQSLLSHDGLIYAVTDKGVAFCWDAKTGKEKWEERVGRGGVMASPLLVGDLIYATIKNGSTVIYKANGDRFEKVAENKLGTDTYATPVAVDDELFMRVGFSKQGDRREYLYCLGE